MQDYLTLPLRGKHGVGQVAIVDADVHQWARHFVWQLSPNGYVYASAARGITLHRIVMGDPEGMDVDHANRDKLDNRRQNLRVATRQQNMANTVGHCTRVSQYKGVTKVTKNSGNGKVWAASITVHYKRHHLGVFDTEIEAARAYDLAATRYRGEFAKLNSPDGHE